MPRTQHMQHTNKPNAARINAFIAILIAVIGGGIGSALLLFTSGMTQVLGALALAATNLLCYPFVVAYWLASGKPGVISALLALQTAGVIALLVWYAKLG